MAAMAGAQLDELRGIGVLRVLKHLHGVTAFEHLAVAHDIDAVTQFCDDAEIVRDDGHGHLAVAMQSTQRFQDLELYRRVERGGRLVGEQQRGLAGKRYRDHDTLPHTAGKLMRKAPRQLHRETEDPPR